MAQCPKCQATLIKAKECKLCGWSRENSRNIPQRAAAPTMDDAHRIVMDEIVGYRGQRPEGMPSGNLEAAKWMLSHVLEKHQPEEAPQLKNKTDGRGDSAIEKWFWVWPYLTRIKIQTLQFLHLSPDYQRYVIAAHEDGIPWRGDEEWFFRKAVAEHQRIIEVGVEAYRKEALAKMRGLTSGYRGDKA